MSKLWISEFTLFRLERHLGNKVPVVYVNSEGWRMVELPTSTLQKMIETFGPDSEMAINRSISYIQTKRGSAA